MDAQLIEFLARRDALSGGRLAMAIVVEATGSVPRRAGAALVAGGGGLVAGTVGGGLLEARALGAARRVLEGGPASILELDLDGSDPREGEMLCGGRVRILVCAVEAPFAAALAALESGSPVFALFGLSRYPDGLGGDVASGPGLIALLDGEAAFLWSRRDLGAAVRASVDAFIAETRRSRARLEGKGECSLRPSMLAEGLFCDLVESRERLLVLGGGHVGRALADCALELGFEVTVADPRPEFSDRATLPDGVRAMRAPLAEAVALFAPRPGDYAVVVSPGHAGDLEAVRALLGHELRYTGFIGSRRKVRMVLDTLVAEGFKKERIEGLCAPIGLDIGAQTPEEIAVAIAAELVAFRRRAPCLARLREERAERRARPGR
jgi:xanthine dehydrogenase accessory factor